MKGTIGTENNEGNCKENNERNYIGTKINEGNCTETNERNYAENNEGNYRYRH